MGFIPNNIHPININKDVHKPTMREIFKCDDVELFITKDRVSFIAEKCIQYSFFMIYKM